MSEMEQKVREQAISNYKKGMNCTEAVFIAMMQLGLIDVPEETQKLCVGFGGGIGCSGKTCGALSGAIMANCAKYGRKPFDSPDETRGSEIAAKYYRRYNNLVHDFEKQFGSALCMAICAKYGDFEAVERRSHCKDLIGDAAVLTYKYLQIPQEEAFKMPYGENMAGLK